MKTQLHAPDPVGAAANKAAHLVSRMDLRLLGAASPTMSRDERIENLLKVLTTWPKLCRAMAELEQAAPNIAAQARQEDARMVDFIEGQRV